MHVVTNCTARLLSFAGPADPKTNLREVVSLLPYQSREVDDATYKLWMSSPIARAGGLRDGAVPPPLSAMPNIAKATPADAIRFVGTWTDLGHLAEWARIEDRPDVLAAIRARQAILTPPPVK